MRLAGQRALPAVLAFAVLASFLAPCLCAAMMPKAAQGHCGGGREQGPIIEANEPACACLCMAASVPTTANRDTFRAAPPGPAAGAAFRPHEGAVRASSGITLLSSPAPAGPPPPPLVQRV
jgi:hypothetical protein